MLLLKLYAVPFFVSGQTYKISKGSNNYCSHCSRECVGKNLSMQCCKKAILEHFLEHYKILEDRFKYIYLFKMKNWNLSLT